MTRPTYINLVQAREVLADMGVELNQRQMQRAAEKNAAGERKLPFFIDPIDGKLKIDRHTLVRIYNNCQSVAERDWRKD
jgi:hypothetical protein